MAVPAHQAQKFELSLTDVSETLPPNYPKIPEAIKKAQSHLRKEWEQYDADVQKFFEELITKQNR